MSKQYSMFIGNFQPWTKDHSWLIDQRLKEGKKVWVAIKSVDPTPEYPYNADQVKNSVIQELHDLIQEDKVFVSIIPDIESINYGKEIDYEIIEHKPISKKSPVTKSKKKNGKKPA